MAEIELVIKIDESKLWSLKNEPIKENFNIYELASYIDKGVALPKGHGRLIDADAYYTDIKNHYFDNATVIRCTEIGLNNALTIIKADKEGDE